MSTIYHLTTPSIRTGNPAVLHCRPVSLVFTSRRNIVMPTNTEESIEQSSRIRKRGIWSFIIRGLLAFGLPFAALLSILDFVLLDKQFKVGVFLILFIVGGFLYGSIDWYSYNRKYRNQKSTDD
jgi:hypothetical protein